MPNTLDTLALEVGLAISPLSDALRSPPKSNQLLARLGWMPPPGVNEIGLMDAPIDAVIANIGVVLDSTPAEWDDELLMATRIGELVDAVAALIDRIAQIATTLPATLAGADDYVMRTRIHEELLPRLLDFLLVNYIAQRMPTAFALLRLLTVVELRLVAADPANYVTEHVRSVINYERISTVFLDPPQLFVTGYGWGTATFAAEHLLTNIGLLLATLGGTAQSRPLSRKVEEALLGRSVPEADTEPAARLIVNLLNEAGVFGGAEVGLALYEARAAAAGATDAGLGVMPVVQGTASVSIPLLGGELSLDLTAATDLSNGINLILRPGQPPLLQTNLFNQGGNSTETARLEAALRYANNEPPIIIGSTAGTRLELGRPVCQGRVTVSNNVTEHGVLVDFGPSIFVVEPGGGDGFLQRILPREGVRASFELAIGWSNRNGLYFRGGAGLDVTLPVRANLFGIVELQAFHVSLRAETRAVGLHVTVTARAHLGPLQASVERMGLRSTLTFPQTGGNLGPINLDLGFQPPTGVGLSLDTGGIVSGGGFLIANHDIGQYAGAVHLAFKAISLQALGILNVRMPDGSPIRMPDGSEGYSLLIIISAEFTPLQLGFGFTLNSVGGILGINRMLAADVLRAGIREGTLGSVLFPRNPAENAPQIISALSSVFPIALNSYVFGPMVRIGWGTPTILTFDLGIVLELGRGLRLAILGRMRMNLPDENTPIVRMNMDVLGIFDFDRAEVSIDASLYDSLIAGFIITGDMALRASWGAQPTFALSAGGFNPRFTPPAGFPALRRLSIALPTGDNPRLRLEAYLALTSNTVQFGARVDLYVEALGFNIVGMLAFDALVQLVPFGFAVDIAGAVALRRGNRLLIGIAVELTLSGPRPWYARGRATVKILFFRVSIGFEVTIGERKPLPPPNPVDVRGRLVDALSDPRNWSAQLPNEGDSLVTFRQIEVSEGQILAHPLGNIRFHQRDVPLGETLEQFGSAPIDGDNRFDVRSVTYGDDLLDLAEIEYEYFAQAQFFDLTEDEKLSAPSFVLMQAGRRVRWSGIDFDESESTTPEALTVEYETAIIDDFDQDPRWVAEPQATAASELERLASVGAAGLTTLRGLASGQTPERALTVRVHDTAYSLVDTSPAYDRQMASIEATRSPMTYTQARANLRRVAGDNPRRASRIRVISERALG